MKRLIPSFNLPTLRLMSSPAPIPAGFMYVRDCASWIFLISEPLAKVFFTLRYLLASGLPNAHLEAVLFQQEIDTLGSVLSVHPLTMWEPTMRALPRRPIPASNLAQYVGKRIRVAGRPITGKEVMTKEREPMEFFSFIFFLVVPETFRRGMNRRNDPLDPLVAANAVADGEERSFPYLGNIPTIRWSRASLQLDAAALKKDIGSTTGAALLERRRLSD